MGKSYIIRLSSTICMQLIPWKICTGIFTGVNNRIIGEKSMLDYVIVSDDLVRYIKKYADRYQ